MVLVYSVLPQLRITCRPSKKLSPIIITVEPPVVQPSLGEIAFITGIADVGYKPGYKAEDSIFGNAINTYN